LIYKASGDFTPEAFFVVFGVMIFFPCLTISIYPFYRTKENPPQTISGSLPQR